MIHVFTTDIQSGKQTEKALKSLNSHFPHSIFHWDLNETPKPYPCGHTILRVAGELVPPSEVITALSQLGFNCEVLEDKVCV